MDPWALLGLDKERATPAEVRRAWRRVAARLHPDAGGDEGKFKAAAGAYRDALAWASQPRLCPECDGCGFYTLRKGGFSSIRQTCKKCAGTGKVIIDNTEGGC